MTTVERYERNGWTVTIEYDPYVSNPHEDAGPGCALALFHKRYALPNDPELVPDWFAGWAAMADHLRAKHGALYVMAVFMIDHSGTAYRVVPLGMGNPFFEDPGGFDSGQVGLAYITPEIWADCQGTEWDGSAEQIAQAQKLITAEVETYGAWANGETFAYTVTDEYGETKADCCGFIGIDAVTEAANEAADGLEHKPLCNGTFYRDLGRVVHDDHRPCPVHAGQEDPDRAKLSEISDALQDALADPADTLRRIEAILADHDTEQED